MIKVIREKRTEILKKLGVMICSLTLLLMFYCENKLSKESGVRNSDITAKSDVNNFEVK